MHYSASKGILKKAFANIAITSKINALQFPKVNQPVKDFTPNF